MKLQQTSPGLLSYENRALYTTWNLSLKHIQSQNESAGKLLRLWAYFDNQDLWFQLLAGGSKGSPEWFSTIVDDELSFNETIRLLCDHALIESLEVFGAYGMHTCVHAWAVHVLNAEREIPMARLALTCIGSAVPTNDAPEYWATERRLLPHARKCFESVHGDILPESQDNQNTLNAVHNLGNLYANQGKMEEAEAMYRRALKGYEKACGPEHTSTLDMINNLGALYADQGKMEEAEIMYQQALNGYEKAWGPKHTSTLDTVNNLANLYKSQGKMEEAEVMYRRALKGCEKAWGPEHTSTLDTVNNLGLLYADQGKMNEAEDMFLRALSGYEKAWDPEHTSMLNTVDSLGGLYKDQGKMYEAEVMHRRALEGKEKAWGPEHPNTLISMHNLADVLGNQGKYEEAEEMFLRTVELSIKVLGDDHPSTIVITGHRASLLEIQGKHTEAEKMYEQTVESLRRHLGREHPRTLTSMANLAGNYQKQGRWDDAKELQVQVLEISKRVFGPDHPVTVSRINDRALNYAWTSTANVVSAWNDDDVVSLPSLTDGSTLKSSQGDDREAAEEFATLLINDETLKALFQVALEKIGTQRFRRNTVKILKDFARNLRQEANSELQQASVELVRLRAQYIVSWISQNLDPNRNQSTVHREMDGLSAQTPQKQLRVEDFISKQPFMAQDFTVVEASSQLRGQLSPTREKLNDDNTDEEESDTDNQALPQIATLEHLKAFMVNSKAFLKLRDNVREFVFPRSQMNLDQIKATSQLPVIASDALQALMTLRSVLFMLYSLFINSVIAGLYEHSLCIDFDRVRWTCVSTLHPTTCQ